MQFFQRCIAKRAARCGQQDTAHAAGGQVAVIAPRQGLENRVVFAVDRQQRRAAGAHRIHEHIARHHQRLLVRQQDFLAGARRRQRGAQARRTDDGSHHSIHFRQHRDLFQCGHSAQHLGADPGIACQFAQPDRGFLIQHHRITRLELLALPEQQIDLAVRRQRNDSEFAGMTRHHVQRAGADTAGGTQNGNVLHRGLLHGPVS